MEAGMSKEKKQNGIGIGTGMILGIAIIYILFGLAMIFVPQFKEIYIIYIAGAIFVVFGIVMIVKYFLTGSYRDIGKYGFSAGVLCVLIGILMLVRTNQIAVYFSLFLGICILLTAIIKLQNAVDLKSMHNKGWFVFLLIALVFLVAAILIILNPGGKVSQYKDVVYYILIADGVINIISPIYLIFAIRTSRKLELAGHAQKASDKKSKDAEDEKAKPSEDDTKRESDKKDFDAEGKEKHKKSDLVSAEPVSGVPKKNTQESAASEDELDDEMTREILHFFEDDK